MWTRALLVALVTLPGLTRGLWAQEALISADQLFQLQYYNFWQARLPLGEGDRIQDLYLVDDTVYAVSEKTVLYAVHADVGTLRWSARMGGAGTRIFAPTHVRSFWGKDLTVVSTSDSIHWVERATGSAVASLDVDFIPSSSAISDGVRVYVGGMDYTLHCYEFVPVGDGVAAVKKWRVRTAGLISSTPALWGGDLFFASHDGRLRACDSFDKTRRWVFRTDLPVRNDFHVDSTGVYFGSDDFSVYKLDVDTGASQWRVRTPGLLRSPPLVYGTLVLQVVQGHGLYAINADTGVLSWHMPDIRAVVSAADDRLFVLTRYRDILALRPDTGEVAAQIYAGGVDVVARNISSGALFVGGQGGVLMCAQNRNVPYLRLEQLQPAEAAADQPTDGAPAVEGDAQDRADLLDLLRSRSSVTPLVD